GRWKGGGAEPLGDPAVGLGQQRPGLGRPALPLVQPAQAHRRPQLPGLRLLPARHLQGLAEAGFRPGLPRRLGLRPQEQQPPPQPMQLGADWLHARGYHGVIDQSGASTDVLLRGRPALAELYPRLLDHACLNLSAQDILGFLGRRLHPRFDGEVLTDGKKDRWPGARVKHRVKNNGLKRYDKFGQVLRIETVINQPREFKVRRRRQRQGRSQMVWCPMNKAWANFYHYHEVARAANERYLSALAVVNRPQASLKILEQVQRPARAGRRRRRGLNLLGKAE